MNPLKKLIGQTAIYGASSIVGRLLNYFLVPLYTRIFEPEIYGIVGELFSYVAFLMIVLMYGMETGFFRFSETEKSFNKVFGTSLISLFATSSVFIILMIVFAQPIANFLDYSENPEYIIWLSIIVGLDCLMAIPFAKLRHQNRAIKFVTIKLIFIFANIGLILFFLIFCPYYIKENQNSVLLSIYSSEIGVGYVFISNLIANILILIILLPEMFNVKISFDFGLLKRMLAFSLPLLVVGFAGTINEVLDRILLKFLSTENVNPMSEIGIYNANYKVALLMTLFIQTFRYAAEPFFFAHAKNSRSKSDYSLIMKYFVIFGLTIFLGATLYLSVLKYFIGEDYRSGLNVVPILLLANLFLGIIYNLSIWYKLTSKTMYGAYIALFGATITIVLNIILIPKIGYLGSAWATFFCYFSMMLLSFFWGKKHYKIKYEVLPIAKYFVIALVLYAISRFVPEINQVFTLLVSSLLFFVFVGYVFWEEKLLDFAK
ncbi:MAG: oligosaccharide flippase family protein [Bacteroidetes bacterium]|nr:oligosaccharide flippase family protein [Bacteroidota bacterium]MBT6687210.1 oligosaccharide flippase family protein [Bacteroidota bacterium]MBT7144575.1 oligosaccharide flippase family protein [Bacteroidota bacterium]MBT7490775.1 oligosaccharide flippase family protein [Bacteroidota bacterium]